MTSNTAKSILSVAALSTMISLGYVAFREDPRPVEAVRVSSSSDYPGPIQSVTYPVAYPGPLPSEGTVQSQSRAVRSLAALSTPSAPILDARSRPCIGIPIPASLTAKRMNLLLTPNLREVMRRSWSDPKWLAMFRVEGGTFPVNLYRKRQGVDTFIQTMRVPAGPNLPDTVTQVALSSAHFRGGDVACVETPATNGPLLVAYDPLTGLVIEPRLSVIEMSSNDATAMPGKFSAVGGVKP